MGTSKQFRLTTFQVIAAGFLCLILAGALLLMLPFASHGGVSFRDCLFTATSAVCVTGLVVRDTATCWTPFGQAVILLLIQIGGLGVVTAALSLSFISGKKIGLMQRSVMQEAISAPQVGGIVRLTRFIIGTSFAIEGIGALMMLPAFIPAFGWGKGLWYAVFHSVSAFCNAGFDLMGAEKPFSSLTGYSQNLLLNLAPMLLITVGGIGFLVWNDVKEHGLRFRQYRLQSKLVLITSALLIVLPALWFYLFDLRDLTPGQRVLPALFQSVTLRTAGFNTVDLSAMSDSSQVIMILCMLTGGSPGSTAGGMKTSTLAVLLITAWAVYRRRDSGAAFGRRISDDTVRSAVAILVMYLVLFFASALAISRIDTRPLLSCLFETASAIGTVGLTLGITPQLSAASHIILIALMFLGRVGGLTLIYAAQNVRQAPHGAYPLENLTVG